MHGNHTTPDAEVLRLAAVEPGEPFTADTLARIRKALDDSGRFRSVDVRKRYASISDTSAVLVVIVVEERAGIAIDVPDPGPLRTLRANTMWMPILRSEDGYGLTYGARVSFVDVLGRRTRLSAPFSWGGERRATVEIERRFERGPLTRVIGTGGITRREHPTLDIGDRRAGGGVRAEKVSDHGCRWPAAGAWTTSGSGISTTAWRRSAATSLSTRGAIPHFRATPSTRVGVQRLWFDSADNVRLTVDARGFVGLFGQTVLALRAQHVRAADPLRCSSSRCSAEMRRCAASSWVTGRAIACWPGPPKSVCPCPPTPSQAAGGGRLRRHGDGLQRSRATRGATWDTGVGAGVFMQAPLIGLRLDVARGLGSGTRVHFTLGTTF